MISFLKGTILEYKDQNLILDVQGVGFHIQTKDTFFKKGEEVSLHIFLQWNQEQGPQLFGFHTELEKILFTTIISCSGIGPKIALSILSSIEPAVFLNIIQSGDEKALSAINGIGKKKAEQLIVFLKHKVEKLQDYEIALDNKSNSEQLKNISEVLTSLHYSRNEIMQAVNYVKNSMSDVAVPFDQLLRKALSFLSKRI